MKSLDLVILLIVFVAFAICLGVSSNIPEKGSSNRANYQWTAAITGIVGFGGLLIMIAQDTAKSSPEGRVANLLENFL